MWAFRLHLALSLTLEFAVTDIAKIARAFLDLFNKHKHQWEHPPVQLETEEIQVLKATMVGFPQVTTLLPGECEHRQIINSGGRCIRYTHLFRAVDKDGHICSFPTGWLEHLINRTQSHNWRIKPTQLMVKAEIERSFLRFKPIRFNREGEMIGERGNPDPEMFTEFEYYRDRLHDDDPVELKEHNLIHMVCGGMIARRSVSLTHDVLLCECCNLRLHIPSDAKTYGNLRRHFADFNG